MESMYCYLCKSFHTNYGIDKSRDGGDGYEPNPRCNIHNVFMELGPSNYAMDDIQLQFEQWRTKKYGTRRGLERAIDHAHGHVYSYISEITHAQYIAWRAAKEES